MKTNSKLPLALDCPDKQIYISTLIYSIVSFFTFPFLLLLFSINVEDEAILVWYELVYHIINFVFVFKFFREYLTDAYDLFIARKNDIFFIVKTAVLAILAVIGLWYLLAKLTKWTPFTIALLGSLPLSEMDIFLLSADIAYLNPIPGTIAMVLLSPMICSCIYYSVAFVPAYNVRPWLGYLLVALLLAFPRCCNAFTHWDPATELVLYLAQLPIHLIACWSYQKADSIYAPILVLTITNLLACGRMIVMALLGV